MQILFIADVFGKAGRHAIINLLPHIEDVYGSPDLIIANGENIAGGFGITENLGKKLLRYGIDVITSGNHIWDRQKDLGDFINDCEYILRPANYPPGTPGRGYGIYEIKKETLYKVAVVNLQGRVFLKSIDCPFRKGEEILEKIKDKVDTIIVDFHAETTAEKRALGFHFDGDFSAIIGTHTHVQTADEQILPNGTAYITDVGMTGPHDSVIGVQKKEATEQLVSGIGVRFKPSKQDPYLCGVMINLNPQTGLATSIERIKLSLNEFKE